MKITKLEIKSDEVTVGYSYEQDHGTVESTLHVMDPGHPDLVNAWDTAKTHVLSLLGIGEKPDKHTFRSMRLKHGDESLEVDFTILRAVPYSTRHLVLNTPPVKSKDDGTGIPDRLHQLLNIIQEEAVSFAKGEKRGQTELELAGSDEA